MIKCVFEDGKELKFRHVTVDALVIKDKKILLIRRASDSLRHPDKYALPGGFLELNETPTEGVMRELLEETGYRAKLATLFKIIASPNRKKTETQDVDFTFLVEVEEQKTGIPDKEASEINWFDLDNLPDPNNFAFDHYEIIQLYIDYLKQKFYLPVFDI